MSTLEMMALTIGVELPQDAGLGIYLQLLAPYPPHVLKMAAIEVMTTHRIRVMPLPAELLETQAIGGWVGACRWWETMMPHFMRLLGAEKFQQGD